MNDKKWFGPKSYGYGWAPSSWQGWFVLALWLAAILVTVFLLMPNVQSDSDVLKYITFPIFAYTALLLVVVTKTGSKTEWRWGGRKALASEVLLHTFSLVSWVLFAEAVGFFGAFFTLDSIPLWYATLNKPFFSPPNWLFGPVWTTLYLFMGVAAYRVWARRKTAGGSRAVISYLIQLALNAVWTPVFFGLQNPQLALAIIIALWCMIIVTIRNFAKVDKLSSWLLWPYLAWVSFATILNLAIVILN